MNERKSNLDTDRLFNAAEAVLAAIRELAAHRPQPLRLSEVVGTPAEPKCLWDYTRDEVGQAADFLCRMGFIQGRAAA